MRLPVSRSSRRSPSRSPGGRRRDGARRRSRRAGAKARKRARSGRGGGRACRTPRTAGPRAQPAAWPPRRRRRPGARARPRRRCVAGRGARSTTRPLSSTSARLQSRWLQTMARRAWRPRPSDDRVRKALVHRERARELLELLVGEVRKGRLRDGDEGQLVRNRDRREGELVGLSDHGRGTSGKPKPIPKPSPASPCLARRRT